ncbi:MAG: gliding motility-associated C-terminal domain-containing protein [Chitinophagales bacterium]|nr:gliding motility-associated C-terminal domain-containing protein [Chitinophagales bacterium]
MKNLQKIFYFLLSFLFMPSLSFAAECDTQYSFEVSICAGQTYELNNQILSESGTYTDTLINNQGCDSIITLQLNIAEEINTRFSPTICAGNSFQVGENIYRQNGIYRDSLVSSKGCDSIVVTNLTVFPVIEKTISTTICEGDSYQIGQNIYTSTGIYRDTLTAGMGCDSIVVTDLTVIPITEKTVNPTICEGQSFYIGTDTFSASGNYTVHLLSAYGCDSIIHLNLTILEIPKVEQDITICQGESIKVGTNTYYESGIYTDTLESSFYCDSIITTILTVKEFTTDRITQTICNGQTFTVGQNTYNQSGIYTDTLRSEFGCDSIVILRLIVESKIIFDQKINLCEGQSYQIGNHVYTKAGIYLDTLVSYGGCDSLVTTEISIQPIYEKSFEQSICEGDSIIFGHEVIKESGNYTHSLFSEYGCDSIIHFIVTVHKNNFDILKREVCAGEIIQIDGINYTHDSTFQQHLSNVFGCDSIIEYRLKFYPTYNQNINKQVCKGSIFQGIEMNSDTIVTQVYQSRNGCDSTVHFHIKVVEIIETNMGKEVCYGENYKGFEIIKDTVFIQTFTSQLGCDSIVTERIHVLPAVEMSISGDTSIEVGKSIVLTADGAETYEWNTGENFPSIEVSPTVTTTYTVTGFNDSGCTQTKTITVKVHSFEITASNFFTPNGDGVHDTWIPNQLDHLSDFTLTILNRWGKVVFTSNHPTHPWNGQYKNTKAPEGVYFFVLEGISTQDGSIVKKSGYIHLER